MSDTRGIYHVFGPLRARGEPIGTPCPSCRRRALLFYCRVFGRVVDPNHNMRRCKFMSMPWEQKHPRRPLAIGHDADRRGIRLDTERQAAAEEAEGGA